MEVDPKLLDSILAAPEFSGATLSAKPFIHK